MESLLKQKIKRKFAKGIREFREVTIQDGYDIIDGIK